MFKTNISKEHFHIINAEHADQTGCTNLAAVKQFELLSALIEILAQGDAVLLFLDFPTLRPKFDVNAVARLEYC